MATEIERKFLIRHDGWRAAADAGVFLRQGYLNDLEQGAQSSIRVRTDGRKGYLNIKSVAWGISRLEYEYEIPLAEANEMLDKLALGPIIEKRRYHVAHGDHVWEVDVFTGDNAGLVVAEIELKDSGEAFDLPDWAGEEVSHDKRYYNVCLVKHPYKNWR